MLKLNLPEAPLQIRNEDGVIQVFDPIRKKFLVLTPEEYVRQHLIYFLLEHKGYPKSLFRVEKGLHYNQQQKRTDIVVFDREGNPYLLVECKSPQTAINHRTFQQAAMYNHTLKAPYYMLSNGLQHFCCEINFENGESKQLEEIPNFPF